ncbi:SDR family oxidoreductase (plasmid) [Embleya sp. NBC_00888]|uniref:SDR family NAD(P)-dependent oxidoreductase n=1 Tax=Embleya sp. NBC_00888 TaxID=2975960 RepID=UPI002F91BC3B|nr:SDR family oxidoreductase [Embleya sp. NBC_00888]
MNPAHDLTDRIAVVTGAAGGIGRATALRLSDSGATVICTDHDGHGAAATARMIETAHGTGRAWHHPLDVTDAAAVDDLIDRTTQRHGRLDTMVNIAGISHARRVVDTDEADLDRVLAVNLKGVFFGCRAAARVMTAQGSGSIVNVASSAIDTLRPNVACYAMSKAAVAQLTKTLAVEAGPDGVRVNAVAPGVIATPMTAGVPQERNIEAAALRRIGQPDDVAWAICYLASPAAEFITGQILRINGGTAMPG